MLRKLFADDVHVKSYFIFILCLFQTLFFHYVAFQIFNNEISILWRLYLFVCVILVIPFSYLIGFIFGVLIFPVIHDLVERNNGGPFMVGDKVKILSTYCNGKIGIIYSTWQGKSFRVKIGNDYMNDMNDIFDGEKVLLIERKPAQQGDTPEPASGAIGVSQTPLAPAR